MGLFLQILGGIFVLIFMVAIGFFVYQRVQVNKYSSLLESAMDMAFANDLPPLLVELEEEKEPNWMKQKKPAKIGKELQDLGFVRSKSYTMSDMEAVCLTAYIKSPLCAVLYQHEEVGHWIDILFETQEMEVTVSNAPMGEGGDPQPHKKIDFLKGHSTEQLYQRILGYQKDYADSLPINAENFKERFEASYKRDQSFTCQKGGMTYEEFIRRSGDEAKDLSDEDLREGFLMMKDQELILWDSGAIEDYQNSLPDEEKANLPSEYDLFIVPTRTDAQAFISHLSTCDFITQVEEDRLQKTYKNETDIYKIFEEINAAKPEEQRAILIAEHNFPLDLMIYQKPPSDEEEEEYDEED